MPKDQPNNHPIGADRPAHIPNNITDLRDQQVFNESIFEKPVQRVEKRNEIIVPASLDMKGMSWTCGSCSYFNPPALDNCARVSIGSVQGLAQHWSVRSATSG